MSTGELPEGVPDTGPMARRMVLGSQLRRLREGLDISRAQAAYSIRSSESKISRMELGRVALKERDVDDLLAMYGIDKEQRRPFLDLLAESNKPGWWQPFTNELPDWFHPYVGLEEAASRIQAYEQLFVPGLLQTEEYARAVVSHGRPETISPEAEQRVAVRMRRQALLTRPNPPRVWAVIDESVLHRPVGGRRVMLGQIERLLELTRLPHVSVQVVPTRLSGYAAESSFTMLRFPIPELPDLVYIEHLAGAHLLEKPKEIEVYRRALDRLTVDAETPDDTRQLLNKRRAEI